MGETTGYWMRRTQEHYALGDRLLDVATAAVLLAGLYAGVGSSPHHISDSSQARTGISHMNIVERVIWGATERIQRNSLEELGSAWYLMHGPS